MSSNELVALNVRNIRKAIEDYGAHTTQTAVLSDVSDSFIERLARYSVYAKGDLYRLLSQSSVWNEELQALVINGTRTHDPDYRRIHSWMYSILDDLIARTDGATREKIYAAMRFFDSPGLDDIGGIAAIRELAPKAYRANKKKSRIFKSLCDSPGVTDETHGSEFQRYFAMPADELNGRKIDFKLYLSINPAHFLTMSNQKCDARGSTLTSCHSFNSTEYPYNCGCTGYALDNVTMIAFTVSDPDDSETFNNRKTTRQLFMYRPYNGLLLQSRMYNTSGGTQGAQKESGLYRDLVQREISELEGVPNLWKTYAYVDNTLCTIKAGEGFGGYQDWIYRDYDAKISIRNDHLNDFETFKVGTYGMCVGCGARIERGLYCRSCEPGGDEVCDECGERCTQTWQVYDSGGQIISVCANWFDENYRYCEECDEYYHHDEIERAINRYGHAAISY